MTVPETWRLLALCAFNSSMQKYEQKKAFTLIHTNVHKNSSTQYSQNRIVAPHLPNLSQVNAGETGSSHPPAVF